jgi:hypothetical protein
LLILSSLFLLVAAVAQREGAVALIFMSYMIHPSGLSEYASTISLYKQIQKLSKEEFFITGLNN